MQKRNLKYAAGVSAAVSAVLILVNCSGGSVDDQHTPDAISQAQSTLAVTGISSTVVFSFDLGVVDPVKHMYYVTDRTNKSITGINLTNNTGFQFKPAGVAFAGCNSTSFNPVTNPLTVRSEEHTSELQSLAYLVCRLLLEKNREVLVWRRRLAEVRQHQRVEL